MGTKNTKGSVTIEQKEKRIRLRWRFQTKRFSLNLFEFNKENLLKARKVAFKIEHDISIDNFDPTLIAYNPRAKKISESPLEKPFIQYFEEWVSNYRNMDCEKDVDYHSTRNMMVRWGSFNESSILHI
jgi:integrase